MSRLTMIRYCETCGARMGCRSSIRAYNPETGHPIYKMVFRCPNNRFWRMGHASETLYVYLDGVFTDQQRRNLEGLDE